MEPFYKLRTRYKWIFKEEWWHVCSTHREYSSVCKACNCGVWKNIFIEKIQKFIYIHFQSIKCKKCSFNYIGTESCPICHEPKVNK